MSESTWGLDTGLSHSKSQLVRTPYFKPSMIEIIVTPKICTKEVTLVTESTEEPSHSEVQRTRVGLGKA